MTPIRIQRKRTKGWKMPENTVYVGRGSRWGNPFRVVRFSDGKWSIITDGSEKCNNILINHAHFLYDNEIDALKDAIKCYDFWLVPYSHKDGGMMEFYQSMAIIDDAIKTLKGKNLACWCPLDKPCHADLLLKLANNIII